VRTYEKEAASHSADTERRPSDVVALEVFTQGPIPFDDEVAMIDIDIDALAYGSSLARRTGLRVHCNVELSTLVLVPGLILDYATPAWSSSSSSARRFSDTRTSTAGSWKRSPSSGVAGADCHR
jgi:hypothetical protein